jgi:hypothetical protein
MGKGQHTVGAGAYLMIIEPKINVLHTNRIILKVAILYLQITKKI